MRSVSFLMPPEKVWHRGSAAVLEIVGVFVTGTLLARMLLRAAGVSSGGLRDIEPGAAVDYLALASSTAASLLVRYGVILGLALLIGWWRSSVSSRAKSRDLLRCAGTGFGEGDPSTSLGMTPAMTPRMDLSRYGVTTAGLSARAHLAIALILFSAGGLLPKLLLFAKDHVSLGPTPRHWELIASADTFAFWVYMAVASFGIVPIVEELFFRGYVQTRLGEAFGAPAAIVMASLLFTLSHRQYFLPSVIGIGMLFSLFLGALFGGYARYRFGTLWPGILAHALGNVPIRGWAQAVAIACMVLVVVLARRALAGHIREVATLIRSRGILTASAVAVAVIAAVLGLAAVGREALLVAGVLALLVALLLDRSP